MNKGILFLIQGFITLNLIAQPLSNDWVHSIGGTGKEAGATFTEDATMDSRSVIAVDKDGNSFLATGSYSNDGMITTYKGAEDCFIVKYNSIGELLWTKSLGGSGFDKPRDMIALDNGDIIIVGYTTSNDGDLPNHHGGNDDLTDGFMARISGNGDIIWTKQYGSSRFIALEGNDYLFECEIRENGNIVAAGRTYAQNGDLAPDYLSNYPSFTTGWFLEVDSADGSVITSVRVKGKIHDQNHSNNIKSFTQLKSGKYAALGAQGYGLSGSKHWVTVFDSTGENHWEKELGGLGTIFDNRASIAESYDGNLMVLVSTGDSTNGYNGGLIDCFLLKLNKDDGSLIDSAFFGGISSDLSFKILPDGKEKYYLVGAAGPSEGNDDFVHGGSASYDNYIIYMTEQMDTVWTYRFGGSDDDRATDAALNSYGTLFVGGLTESFDHFYEGANGYGGRDAWLGKFRNDVASVSEFKVDKISVYPNPTSDMLYISMSNNKSSNVIELIDCQGKIVRRENVNTKHAQLNVSGLENGIYFIRVISKENIYTKKVFIKK